MIDLIYAWLLTALDWKLQHKPFHVNMDRVHLSNPMQDHKRFRWPKNNVFLGNNYAIQPDPVD